METIKPPCTRSRLRSLRIAGSAGEILRTCSAAIMPPATITRTTDHRVRSNVFTSSPGAGESTVSLFIVSGPRSGCFRPRIGKGFDRGAGSADTGDLRKRVERHVETPRVVDLGHQSHVRQGRPVAKAERFSFHQAF